MRSFIFGVEDSLVATVGLVSGIASAGAPQADILLAGIVLTFVEAFSMAAGSFLSESSAQELVSSPDISVGESVRAAFIMFFSYFVTGFIVIAPYVFFPQALAFQVSIVVALASLFALGVVSAKLSNTSVVKKGMTMVVIGGAAIVIGVVAGSFLHLPYA